MINKIINFCVILIAGDLVYREMEEQGLISYSPSNLIFDIIFPWRWLR